MQKLHTFRLFQVLWCWPETAAGVKKVAKVVAELGSNTAVDEQVCGGVDDQQHVREEAGKYAPDWKPTKQRVLTQVDHINHKSFMHVENKARKIADDKGSDNDDEDD